MEFTVRGFKEKIRDMGFCRIENIFSESDLDYCDSIITSMIKADYLFLDFFKSTMSDEPSNAKKQIELTRPSVLSLKLRQSQVFKRCHMIAKEYFGGTAYYWYDHAIFKMPNSPVVTHWHQDQAYLGSNVTIPSLHFWIPFQETHADNGAMQFVDSSHYRLLPHILAYPEKSHVLKVKSEPVGKVYCMNINRGDVSLHTNLTLHSAGPNKSNYSRKAWIIHFGKKPSWYKRISQASKKISP